MGLANKFTGRIYNTNIIFVVGSDKEKGLLLPPNNDSTFSKRFVQFRLTRRTNKPGFGLGSDCHINP